VKPTEQVQMIILHNNTSFFTSSDGSRAGHLQIAILRRTKQPANAPEPADAPNPNLTEDIE